jgi:hypothetical protein
MDSPGNRHRPSASTAHWVNSLIIGAVLCVISCDNSPVEPVSVLVNPYSFESSDLESARLCFNKALQDSVTLEGLEQLSLNPYQFKGEDIAFATQNLQESTAKRATLQSMLDRRDYEGLGGFIPNHAQIDEGRAYWFAEKARVDTVAKPYWQDEHQCSLQAQCQTWGDFCEDMIDNLRRYDYVIYLVLEGLDLDEDILNRSTAETLNQVASRKMYVETVRVIYFTDLVGLLNRGMELEIPDWTGLGDFIPSMEQIEQGKTYWLERSEAASAVEIPYWQSQRRLASTWENAYWTAFCVHMIESLDDLVDLAQAHLEDLQSDRDFINGKSGESPESVANRKRGLASREIEYYGALMDVISEGMALGVLLQE